MKYDVRYSYSAASVASLFGRIADRAMTERLIDAKEASDSLKLIEENGYGYTQSAENNIYEYERLIIEEERKLYLKVDELLPEKKYVEFLQVKNDCHNIKVVLKDEIIGTENAGYLNDNGTINKNRIRVLIRDRNFKEIPDEFKKAVNKALDLYARTKNPSAIDIQIDKACFKIMKRIADETKNSLLKDIAEFFIDSVNIKTLIRNMVIGGSVSLLRETIIPGGTVLETEYFNLVNGTLDNVVTFFNNKPMGEVVEEGLHAYENTGSLSLLEKLFDEYYLDIVRKYRFSIDGPEPVIYYYVLKELEMRNVKLIMTGKINGLPKDDIRERVRRYNV